MGDTSFGINSEGLRRRDQLERLTELSKQRHELLMEQLRNEREIDKQYNELFYKNQWPLDGEELPLEEAERLLDKTRQLLDRNRQIHDQLDELFHQIKQLPEWQNR